ncbi:MAG TPA: FliH/SctL family protein [Bryobacteraceae bacterium]|nr:FliH/SctL family protein [Bryobacteraceae bacterium]
MLSKILAGAAAAAAQSWAWPAGEAAGPGAAAAAGRPPDPGALERPAEWEQQAARRAAEARQEGLREGEAAGRAQAAAQLQPVLEKLAHSIADIGALRPRLMREAEAELVDLSLGIARRILRRELSVDPDALEGLVKAALEKLPAQDVCRVRTHPDLEDGIRHALAKAGRTALAVVPDSTLERGAVWLETTRGKLDASLESQLAEIGRGLADRLGDH